VRKPTPPGQDIRLERCCALQATLLGIALMAPFVLKGLGRFKANED
jgi:hypothetical protein